MRTVLALDEANALLRAEFPAVMKSETVTLSQARGRVLARDVTAEEDVPGFVRSTVDGYAVRACDTFGCTESIPAMLRCIGAVHMGERTALWLAPGTCAAVPTGGELPANADAMVMTEYVEDFGGGTVAIEKAAAPGQHLVFAGDDARKGETVLFVGRRLASREIGVLAALGCTQVPVYQRPRVAILSTGDELIDAAQTPVHAQVRDVNGPLLSAQCAAVGGAVVMLRRIADDESLLRKTLIEAAEAADLVLLSGGSSVGEQDAAERTIASLGKLLFHGLAVKPGKPTLCGRVCGVPMVGLPGHPVAACLIGELLVRPMLLRMLGTREEPVTRMAALTAAVPSNHGREEYVPVRLTQAGEAEPIIGKSGLITMLAQTDGYICIPRDTEGLLRGASVAVRLWNREGA